MKRKEFIAEIRGLSSDDLQGKAKQLAEEVMKLRFRKATGQLDQSHRLGDSKRNLARVLSEVKARGMASGSSSAQG